MNLWLIFLTGLTTGGLSCLAVQGGLLTSVIANQKQREIEGDPENKSNAKHLRKQKYLTKLQNVRSSFTDIDSLDWMPVAMFLFAKLISHTVLGFLLGGLGSVLELSIGVRLAFQGFTAIFMLATAGNLLGLHPIFRYIAFTPPKFIRKMIKNTSKNQALFAPFILGLMTIFIPCGVTQAMEVLVINNGSAVQGALMMFAFVLGTMPLFSIIGIATAKLSETWHNTFTKVAAYALIFMSLYSINGVLQASDAPISVQKITLMYQKLQAYEKGDQIKIAAKLENGIQKMTLNVNQRGYAPNYFTVKQGMPVELTVNTNGVYTCASAFTFKAFNIAANLKPTDSKTFKLNPNNKGQYLFSCSMGMYTGVMEVI